MTSEHVEGEVYGWTVGPNDAPYVQHDVPGLAALLKRFAGKRVEIRITEIDKD